MSRINWFPGHMAKTTADLKTQAKSVDMVIEVVDARAIKTSSNEDLTNIFTNKKKLTIALKSDLADVTKLRLSDDTIVGSIKDKSFHKKITKAIDACLSEKVAKMRSKGLINPQLYIIIVGLPNIGKSSLINFLGKKNLVNVENRPGVTRNRQIVKITDSIFLYDTPGVLFKNIEDINDGYVLSLINCIKKEVLPLEDVVEFGYNFFINNYSNDFMKHYEITGNLSFTEFLKHVSQKYNFVSKNNIQDTERTISFLFDEFSSGKICKINYEKEQL